MAQARTPAGSGAGTGTGSERIADTTQLPTALVFDEVPGIINSMGNGLVHYEITDGTLFSGTCESTSADFVWKMTAADNGRIVGLTYSNGATAMDGTNGWELAFINSDQSNENVGYFGIGSGTEAAKGTDNDVAVAANATVFISNSLTSDASHFSRGDVIQVTADRDGTAGVGTFVVLVSYESQGHV
jgi:hypothetical protein|tara:strand:+ start:822 stop:1382 length:561 start_codon:yes stop_codon:yes gene_type:complete